MSGWTPEEEVAAKDKRRGVIEQKPGKGRSKRDTPITVYYRWPEGFLGISWLKSKWEKLGSYRDMQTAEHAINQKRNKHRVTDFKIIDTREQT